MKYYLAVFVLFLFSCSKQESFFHGTITNAQDGKWVYLEKVSLTDINRVDSCKIENNVFSFNYSLDSISLYRIFLEDNNFGLMALKKGDSVHFTADASSLFNYSASGSKQVEINSILFSIINSVTSKSDSLRLVYQKSIGTAEEQTVLDRIRNKYNSLMLEKEDQIKQFIENNSSSFITIIALQELGDVSEHIEYYKMASDQLSSQYPNNPWVMDLKKRTLAVQNTAIGSAAPLFSMNDTEGNMFHLSDLKGSFVLIDFWASWCAPCRRENPLLVELYKEFNPKGLEIISVSLDDTVKQKNGKQDWISAIENDQLTWTQLSQLQGFDSSVCKKYGIESIPSTYLIDKDGIIIARNLRGALLRNKLIDLFD